MRHQFLDDPTKAILWLFTTPKQHHRPHQGRRGLIHYVLIFVILSGNLSDLMYSVDPFLSVLQR